MDEPLADALRAENRRLRAAVVGLTEELAASRAAEAELGAQLRLMAPLRRVQERLRLAAQSMEDRLQVKGDGPGRRWATRSAARVSPQPGSARRPGDTGAHASAPQAFEPERQIIVEEIRALPPDVIGRHPLLLRTLEWATGSRELPAIQVPPHRTGRTHRVLVIAHVYYPDLWPMLAQRIERIPAPVDLVVTLAGAQAEAAAEGIAARHPDVTLVHVPNRGRDMAPLLRVLEMGLVGDHAAVLKLHTKRSVHRIDGDHWRDALLDSLCGSTDQIELILRLLRSDSDVGMVAGVHAALGHRFWGANGPLVSALAVRAGVSFDPRQILFPGGSMFWSRPAPLHSLLLPRLTLDDFERETLTIDGTTAHALERFVGVAVELAGQRVISADGVAGELARVRVPSQSQ